MVTLFFSVYFIFAVSFYIKHSSPKVAFFAYLVPLSHHLSMTFYDVSLVCVHCRTLYIPCHFVPLALS